MDGKGVTLRARLEQVERSTGRRPAPLDPEPLPEPAWDAWGMWLDLHRGRASNGWGPSPLSWLDLDAWSRMRGVRPTFSQLELIRTIDRAYLESQKTTEAEQ